MNLRIAVILAVAAALSVVPFGTAHAQKNKNNKKNQPDVIQDTAAPALMPGQNYFYVTIRGVKQGILKGQSTTPNHPNEIMGFRYVFQLTSPRDNATGQATGRRQYSPITFTKQVDASSPELFEAASSNEMLQLVQFDFVRAQPDGKEVVSQTIKLTNATISSIKMYMGFPDGTAAADPRQLEDVSFTFQKIEISNNDGKTTFLDDWTSAQ